MTATELLGLLAADDLTIAVAESCTGGMLGAALTDVPGASRSFRGGIIAYTDDLKVSLLGVDAEALASHGAVSAYAVEAMAHGARDLLGVDMVIAISGVAGPGGGTGAKPVGTVWIAVLGPEHILDVKRHRFEGGRDQVRTQAVEAALARGLEMVEEAELEGVA